MMQVGIHRLSRLVADRLAINSDVRRRPVAHLRTHIEMRDSLSLREKCCDFDNSSFQGAPTTVASGRSLFSFKLSRSSNLLAATAFAAAISPSLAGSTTSSTPGPAQNRPTNAAAIRANFNAASNDINNVLSMYYGPTAPRSPRDMQGWANSARYPNIVMNYYNAGAATWIPYARLNIAPNAFGAVPSLPKIKTLGCMLASLAPVNNFDAGIRRSGAFIRKQPQVADSAPAGDVVAQNNANNLAINGSTAALESLTLGGKTGPGPIINATSAGAEAASDAAYSFFESESYANKTSTFHLPFVVQDNDGGTGPRQALTTILNANASKSADFLVSEQPEVYINGESGFAIGSAPEANVASGAAPGAQAEAIETATTIHANVVRDVGLKLVSHNDYSGFSENLPAVSDGIIIASDPGTNGWINGITLGEPRGGFPISPNGRILTTASSSVKLAAGIDFSNLTGSFPDLVLGSSNGKIYFGNDNADGGEIETLTGSGGPIIGFGFDEVVIETTGGGFGIGTFSTSEWVDQIETDCTSPTSTCSLRVAGGVAVADSGWFGRGVHAQYFIAKGAIPTAAAGQIGYSGATVARGTGTCPTTPGVLGCEVHNIAGRVSYIPYY